MELQAETRNGTAAACAADSSRCLNKESEFGREIMEGDMVTFSIFGRCSAIGL